MNALTDSLKTMEVSPASKFSGRYKNAGAKNAERQEDRRKKVLSAQKLKRANLVDSFRNLTEFNDAPEKSRGRSAPKSTSQNISTIGRDAYDQPQQNTYGQGIPNYTQETGQYFPQNNANQGRGGALDQVNAATWNTTYTVEYQHGTNPNMYQANAVRMMDEAVRLMDPTWGNNAQPYSGPLTGLMPNFGQGQGSSPWPQGPPETQYQSRDCDMREMRPDSELEGSYNTADPMQVSHTGTYTGRLMMSEVFEEVPSDFDSNWLMVCCPRGKRSLVIASHGTTRSYNKFGAPIDKFQSKLHGGSKFSTGQVATVLDCIYVKNENKYWILDVMWWRDQPLADCDLECRRFWLNSHLPENDRFQVTGIASCSSDHEMTDVVNKYARVLDGLLFFHKFACYEPGVTPLALWLKPEQLYKTLGLETVFRNHEFLSKEKQTVDVTFIT